MAQNITLSISPSFVPCHLNLFLSAPWRTLRKECFSSWGLCPIWWDLKEQDVKDNLKSFALFLSSTQRSNPHVSKVCLLPVVHDDSAHYSLMWVTMMAVSSLDGQMALHNQLSTEASFEYKILILKTVLSSALPLQCLLCSQLFGILLSGFALKKALLI